MTLESAGAITLGALSVLWCLGRDEGCRTLAKLVRDLCRSRIGSLAYRTVGRAVRYAEACPLPRVGPRPEAGTVTVVRTSKRKGERLKEVGTLSLVPGSVSKDEATVVLQPTVRFQKLLGFGGSFTESSAELLQSMSSASQERIIDAYFSAESGLGYRFGRVHMNSCDFSRGNWACAETPGDVGLKNFSIERYKAAILPMIRRAIVTAGGSLPLLFSPWSPPAWMKDNGDMHGGKLKPEYLSVWARYFVRFAQEFKAEGVPLWGCTVQNEPDAPTPWETCHYTAEEERDFVRDHLGPSLEASGLGLKLLVWDHNRDLMFARASTIYSDPAAARYVWGMGFHWYGDPRHEFWPPNSGMTCFDNVQRVHELCPDKHLIMTEACQEMGPRIGNWKLGERYAESIIKDLNNWCEAWIDWNLLLDVRGGPNWAKNCCSAPVIADAARDRVLFLSSFYYIGHFSRYIKPGAQRIAVASSRDALEVTAFANPDGTLAAVVLNQSGENISFQLECGGSVAKAKALPHSISTFVLSLP